jgi:hypothetical protein
VGVSSPICPACPPSLPLKGEEPIEPAAAAAHHRPVPPPPRGRPGGGSPPIYPAYPPPQEPVPSSPRPRRQHAVPTKCRAKETGRRGSPWRVRGCRPPARRPQKAGREGQGAPPRPEHRRPSWGRSRRAQKIPIVRSGFRLFLFHPPSGAEVASHRVTATPSGRAALRHVRGSSAPLPHRERVNGQGPRGRPVAPAGTCHPARLSL